MIILGSNLKDAPIMSLQTGGEVARITEPLIASRTQRTILGDMGEQSAAQQPSLEEALDLAQRLANAAEAGRVDLHDLGRRARKLLASTTPDAE